MTEEEYMETAIPMLMNDLSLTKEQAEAMAKLVEILNIDEQINLAYGI